MTFFAQTDEPTRHVALGDNDPDADIPEGSVLWPIGFVALLVFLGVRFGLAWPLVILGLVLMIFLHELGHFMTARWTGMKATQFFLGFGPTLWSFKRGEVTYGLKAIPAGAFVRIIGMNNLDPVDPVDADRAYMNKSYPRRMLVITAGSLMHFLQAIVLFTIGLSVVGVPSADAAWRVDAIVETVELAYDESGTLITDPAVLREIAAGEPTSVAVDIVEVATPAGALGLELGDRIVAVDGAPIETWDDLTLAFADRAGSEVELVFERDGAQRVETVTLLTRPGADGELRGFFGIGPAFDRERQAWTAGPEMFVQGFGDVITAIPQVFNPTRIIDLIGLVAEGSEEVSITSEEAQTRPVSVVGAARFTVNSEAPLVLLGFINLFVGIFNLIPLLPLDGGHAAIATYERIRSRKGMRHQVDVAKLLPLTYGVIMVVGLFGVLTIWLDIVRPIT